MRRTYIAVALVMCLSILPRAARADVVLDWNAVMLTTLAGQNPFAQARFAAIVQLAVFEGVNAITRDYEPYSNPIPAPAGASADAAAVAAAHTVLKHYFPLAAGSLDAARDSSLAAIPEGTSKHDGIAVGEAAAAAMIALRTGDGAGPPQFFQPTSGDPGQWQPTAGCPPGGGILLHWRHVTPFAVRSGSQFRSAPPPALTSVRYAKDYKEVKNVGVDGSMLRPQDRADVARFYNAVLAVGVWNRVAAQLATASGTSLSENARVLALINMAISDALVTVMESKYHYTFWRPATAVPAGDADGNPSTIGDPAFSPFIPTPCFPSYPSAHASASYAARRIIQLIWGNDGHSIGLEDAAVSGITLHYATLKAITDDIDDARVFGGIHFRFDQDAGRRQGRRIGNYVFEHKLRVR
jgi:hypothetical protein